MPPLGTGLSLGGRNGRSVPNINYVRSTIAHVLPAVSSPERRTSEVHESARVRWRREGRAVLMNEVRSGRRRGVRIMNTGSPADRFGMSPSGRRTTRSPKRRGVQGGELTGQRVSRVSDPGDHSFIDGVPHRPDRYRLARAPCR